MNYPWLSQAQDEFSRRLLGGQLAHACLITGPRGMGKVEFAMQLAADLLCKEQAATACGKCRSCELLSSGAHPDFNLITIEVNPKTGKMRTEIIIDQVRRLNASMQLTNSLSPRKVAIIHPAEAMNRNASNALLKTLEEPPGDAVLILVSNNPSRLTATIRSRCQVISLHLPGEQESSDWLISRSGKDLESVHLALEASAGSPLLALQMLETGETEAFRSVSSWLRLIESDESRASEVMAGLGKMEPDDAWKWLSLYAAQQLRHSFGAGRRHPAGDEGKTSISEHKADVTNLAKLQNLADRNRRILSSQLRKDLLLRDWLIQWARLDKT